MDFQPKSHKQIRRLIEKGVDIPNPQTLDIGNDVNIDQISAKNVTIYPGCRIYGNQTVISAGCKLGYEAPLTIEDCQLGESVELKGGFVSKSVFLDGTTLGMGAHVREGCLLEEEASGAHSVGLKQTILFPFVTIGSLANFCDCFMSGGTSRSDHSEVGSSYIHFNFTPDADKSTPSLIGDVPRGVMLNQPPIFLGGQGGIVGPVRIGYGNVVTAGSIVRRDYLQDHQLISDSENQSRVCSFIPKAYFNFRRLLENNILYLANLRALEEWYARVRKPFLETREFGSLIFEGTRQVLAIARQERLKRLRVMVQKANSVSKNDAYTELIIEKHIVHENMDEIENVLLSPALDDIVDRSRETFLKNFASAKSKSQTGYIETVQQLPPDISAQGVQWLQNIVDYYCQRTATVVSSVKLFQPA